MFTSIYRASLYRAVLGSLSLSSFPFALSSLITTTQYIPVIFKKKWKPSIQKHAGAADCPNGFPDGNTYKKITATRDTAGNAPKQPAPSSSASTTKGKGKVVAAITPAEQEESEDDDGDFVTTVMPSAALGNGSFSKEDVSPPLRSKHFITKFKIYGPHSDFALNFSALIDNGAHVVLIRPEVVDELGLKRHLLPVPEPVDVAITDGKKKKKKMLTEYVKLSITSVDNAWTSRTVHTAGNRLFK